MTSPQKNNSKYYIYKEHIYLYAHFFIKRKVSEREREEIDPRSDCEISTRYRARKDAH